MENWESRAVQRNKVTCDVIPALSLATGFTTLLSILTAIAGVEDKGIRRMDD